MDDTDERLNRERIRPLSSGDDVGDDGGKRVEVDATFSRSGVRVFG